MGQCDTCDQFVDIHDFCNMTGLCKQCCDKCTEEESCER